MVATQAIDEPGQGGAVKIDDTLPWPAPVGGELLVTVLSWAMKSYAAMRDEEAAAIAVWILHTWSVNEFAISPRLAITSSAKGCGETTLLSVLGHLVRRPRRAGSVSTAALFRLVQLHQPTLLLDEQENDLAPGSDLHVLLNEGHAKGATVVRVLGEQLREFAVYGAMAFARNGGMPDDLAQRSIVIELQRRRQEDKVLRPDESPGLDRLARMAARWSADHRADIGAATPAMPGLIGRVADNWRPLFSIAEVIGGDWPGQILRAARALGPREEPASTGLMLLADVKTLFEAQDAGDKLLSAEICQGLAAMEGRPWAEFGKARSPISQNQLARLLKDFRIAPDTMRLGDRVAKGYRRHQFEDAWETRLASAAGPPPSSPLCRYNVGDGGVAAQTGGRSGAPVCTYCGLRGTSTAPLLEARYDGQEIKIHEGCVRFYRRSER